MSEKWKKAKLSKLISIIAMIGLLILPACQTITDIFGGDDGNDGGFSILPTKDPWEEALTDAKNSFASNPDFEASIRSIQSEAGNISQQLAIVEETKPALDLLDNLHDSEIPLIGNGYDVLIRGLNVAQPGAGDALQTIENGVRRLLEVKTKLDALGSLGELADASQRFRNNADIDSLVRLDAAVTANMAALESVDSELIDALDNIGNVLDAIDLFQTGLQFSSNLLNMPIVGSVLSTLSDAIGGVSTPLRNLEGQVSSFHGQIRTDLDLMDSLQGIVATAQQKSPVRVDIIPDEPSNIDESQEEKPVTEVVEDVVEETEEVVEEPEEVVVETEEEPEPEETEPPEEDPTWPPTEIVGLYWDLVSDRDYQTAWNLLSDGFKDRNHDGKFSDYQSGYQGMNVCRIDSDNIKLKSQTGNNAVVYVHLTYYVGTNCAVSEYDFDIYMLFDSARSLWLIDRVMYAED